MTSFFEFTGSPLEPGFQSKPSFHSSNACWVHVQASFWTSKAG